VSYCSSIFQTKRFQTREVLIGKVAMGAHHPIRIQSMTTFDASNLSDNLEQILQLQEEGCEIVRLAIQGKKQALGMEILKGELEKRKCFMPLVADVHFLPEAALWVADFADKIRINPGNFVKEATEDSFEERAEEQLFPLIQKCQKRKIPLRLGSNSGSLSKRILYKYGNTPKGLVFSALEYADICRNHGYHELVFSMKASNPLTTITAYRLLVSEMIHRGWNYPIHLGVTEAGEGEEGRIKSSVGIGSLLLDGIGDTIRVSLTENPVKEIAVAKTLCKMAKETEGKGVAFVQEKEQSPLQFVPRKEALLFLKINDLNLPNKEFLSSIGCEEQTKGLSSVDGLYFNCDLTNREELLNELKKKNLLLVGPKHPLCLPLYPPKEALFAKEPFVLSLSSEDEWDVLFSCRPKMIFFQPKSSPLHESRKFFHWLQEKGIDLPFLLDIEEQNKIVLSSQMGSLLCDGIGFGVLLSSNQEISEARLFGLSLFQACRLRMSQTEFVSCPGCGRTLFDLQSLVQDLKANLPKVPGLKIAIMGCVVNGLGEMEDAEFGVVGSANGFLDLYVDQKLWEKNLSSDQIKERLHALIKAREKS
jgi:(E)-4-hydroxy-3-methylbut-2-enyl-diphosphate synthase